MDTAAVCTSLSPCVCDKDISLEVYLELREVRL
jgi:hypothetical protein